MKRKILFFVLFFGCYFFRANDFKKTDDSIFNKIMTVKRTSSKVEILQLNKIISISRIQKNRKVEILSYQKKISILNSFGNFDLALKDIKYLDSIIKENDYVNKCKLNLNYIECLISIGFPDNSKIKKAIEHNYTLINNISNDEEKNYYFIKNRILEIGYLESVFASKDINYFIAKVSLLVREPEAKIKFIKNEEHKNEVLGRMYIIKAFLELYSKNLNNADYYLKYASKYIYKTHNSLGYYKLYKALGVLDSNRGNKKKLEYLKKAYEISEKHELYFQELFVLPMLANAYDEVNNKPLSVKFYKEYLDKKKVIEISISNAVTNINDESDNKMFFLYSFLALGTLLLVYYLIKKQINKQERNTNLETLYSKTEIIKLNKISLNDLYILKESASVDINVFYLNFKNYFPEFYDYLLAKFPVLNNNDINFCALLFMNFSTKEISIYTNSTVKAIENKKYRLRKKLNLSPETDLYKFVGGFRV